MSNQITPAESVQAESLDIQPLGQRTQQSTSTAVTCHQSSAIRPKISMSELTTYRWSLLDDVTQYSDAGIGAIGIWRPKLVEFGEERGIELLRDSDLAVSSVSWAGGFTGANGHSLADAIDDATAAIQLCADLGAKSLVIASGPR